MAPRITSSSIYRSADDPATSHRILRQEENNAGGNNSDHSDTSTSSTTRVGQHQGSSSNHRRFPPHHSTVAEHNDDNDDNDDESSGWSPIDPLGDDAGEEESEGGSSGIFRWLQRSGNNNNNHNRRRRATNMTIPIKVPIPCVLCDCAAICYDWTLSVMEVWFELLTAPPCSVDTLRAISILLLGVEKIRDTLDQSTLLQQLVFDATTSTPQFIKNGTHNNNSVDINSLTLADIPQYLLWGIPAGVAMLSISFILTLQLTWGHQEEAVIATALILLVFLEALLPLFILGCASMFLFQQVSWETGLLLLVVVWVGSTFCAHCVRRMLYQSLGHG